MSAVSESARQKSRKVNELVKYFDNISSELAAGKTRICVYRFKQSDKPFSKNGFKSNKIIQELLKTEETYFQTLRHIIGNYIFFFKRELDENIFKHLEDLGRHQVTFYVDLLESKDDSERIGHCFLKHKELFYYYKVYINDMYELFDILSTKYNKLVEARRKQLGDTFRLADQLLTPFQRLTRYILLLRNILKQEKHGPNNTLSEAITYLEGIAVELNLNT